MNTTDKQPIIKGAWKSAYLLTDEQREAFANYDGSKESFVKILEANHYTELFNADKAFGWEALYDYSNGIEAYGYKWEETV